MSNRAQYAVGLTVGIAAGCVIYAGILAAAVCVLSASALTLWWWSR